MKNTHKIVMNEDFTSDGINYTSLTDNCTIMVGDIDTIRIGFEKLYKKSFKIAKEEINSDCKSIKRSKNNIVINTVNDTVINFDIKKLNKKELKLWE